VSPTGKYIALGAKSGLVIVSVEDGKEIGTILSPVPFIAHKAVRFSPDGKELWSLGVCMEPKQQFEFTVAVWDFATGRLLRRSPLVQQINNYMALEGDLLAGPEPRSILFRAGVLNGRLETGPSGSNTLYSIKHSEFLDTSAGARLSALPLAPLRWAGPEHLLALVRAGDLEAALRVVPFDAAAFREAALPLLALSEPRPPAVMVKNPESDAHKVTSPEKWMAPPTADAPPPAASASDLPTLPQGYGGKQAAVLKFVYQEKPRGRNEYHLERMDLLSCTTVGQPIRLWPWIASPEKHGRTANTQGYYSTLQRDAEDPNHRWFQPGDVDDLDPGRALPLAALSLDDKWLAACDPADRARVDIWDAEGKRITGLQFEVETALEWLGWSPGGKLLTVVAGTLTAWDVATGKSVFSVAGNFTGPIAYGANRKWLALAHSDAVELVDSETGNSLGRCTPTRPGGAIESLAVSPDGKAVATARQAMDGENKGPTFLRYLVDVWDMATGKSFTIVAGSPRLEFLHWCTPDHVLVVSGRRNSVPLLELIDRLTECKLCVYDTKMYAPVRPGDGNPRMTATADGRMWLRLPEKVLPQSPRFWRPFTIPQAGAPAEQVLLDPNRRRFDPAEIAVRVEVDLGGSARSRSTAENLARQLANREYRIGPNGFVLRYVSETLDSGQSLNTGIGAKELVLVPRLEAKWEFIDDRGATIWQTTDHYDFKHALSKYFMKSKPGYDNSMAGGPFVFVEYFDFQGKNPRQAIEEELLEDAAKVGLSQYFPSGSFLLAGGKYATLPLTFDFAIPAGAPPDKIAVNGNEKPAAP
jgi:WD40 repeat protein